MHRAPDHSPAAAAAEHAALIVALDAGDLAGRERDAAATLAGMCPGCASLLADLAVIRAATAALPAPARTRDYRLKDADAARLRPSAWRRVLEWLAAPRSTVRPLAGGLAALGIAGLILSTTPGFVGGTATSLSTTGAPVVAPGAAGAAGAPMGGSSLASTEPGAVTRPGGGGPVAPVASPAPEASPMLGAAGATPGAALPGPSAAVVALPAPSSVPAAGTVTAPATAATAGPAGVETGPAAAADSATKAAPPEASAGERNASLPFAAESPPQDRTVPLVLSLALLVVGLGLLATNRMLRGRVRS